MLLYNKTQTDNNPVTVIEFLKRYTEEGQLDFLAGFFSVNALSMMHDNLNNTEQFRLILGNLMQDEKGVNKVIGLLNDDAGIDNNCIVTKKIKYVIKIFHKQGKEYTY
jgi:hypothetical protein